MWNVIAGFVGGMGLFFMGLKLTSDGVKKIAGRRFRDLFLKGTKYPPAAALLGVISGFVFQSASGISLILASLIGARVTTVRNCLPVLIGANAGVACLVLIAVVDIRVLVLILLGVSGLVLAFEKPHRFLQMAFIAFGVGLLLFGLQTVRTGAAPLAETPWFRELVAGQALALPWYFVIGTAAGFVLQTAAGVTILAITLAGAGIVDSNDALSIIFGSLLGTSLLYWLYSLQFTGARKRLVLGQMFFNIVGLVIFLPLFLLENNYGIPLLAAAAGRVFPDLPHQLTAIRLSFDCSTALILFLCTPLYNRFLERICPDDTGSLDSLAYVKELTGVAPETALLLIGKEQERVVQSLALFPKRLRQSLEDDNDPNFRQLDRAVHDLADLLDGCLLDMVSREQAVHNANTIALLQANLTMLRSLSETLSQLVDDLAVPVTSASMERLRDHLLEALDTLLLQAGDVFFHRDQEDWDIFLRLVSDKEPAMEHLRGRYLREHGELDPAEQWRVMRVTGLYERTTWLLRKLGEQQQRFLSEMSETAVAVVLSGNSGAAPTASAADGPGKA